MKNIKEISENIKYISVLFFIFSTCTNSVFYFCEILLHGNQIPFCNQSSGNRLFMLIAKLQFFSYQFSLLMSSKKCIYIPAIRINKITDRFPCIVEHRKLSVIYILLNPYFYSYFLIHHVFLCIKNPANFPEISSTVALSQ